jgi:hypothetical protein
MSFLPLTLVVFTCGYFELMPVCLYSVFVSITSVGKLCLEPAGSWMIMRTQHFLFTQTSTIGNYKVVFDKCNWVE